MGEFPLTRYNVCLIARTWWSRAAVLTKFTTGSKDSYGWWRRISPLRILVKISSSLIKAGFGCGMYRGAFKWSNPSIPYIFIKNVKSKGPLIEKISPVWISNSFFSRFSNRLSAFSSISKRIASPHRRFFNCFSISFNKSSASSTRSFFDGISTIRGKTLGTWTMAKSICSSLSFSFTNAAIFKDLL